MGKHDTIAFKLQVLQPILKGKMSIREAAHFYNIPSLYLILDLFNNEIVSYTVSYFQNWAQVEKMLKLAVKRLDKTSGSILHSDQGWQYQMAAYRQILAEHGIIQSMSRKGNCLDNAAMESFFGRLKTECFYGREFNTREEIVNAVRDYLDYDNHRRIQLKLKGLSPIQYRRQSLCK